MNFIYVLPAIVAMAARDIPTAMTEMPTLRTSVLTTEQGLTDTAAMTDTTGMIHRL